jgi:hypothetical protein
MYVNSFQAIAPLTAHEKEGAFLGGISPSKIRQALSKARVYLLSENERKLLCMGRTSTDNKPLPNLFFLKNRKRANNFTAIKFTGTKFR